MAVESGLFPLFEAEHGEVTNRYTLRQRVPVDAYLKLQRRFSHLFGKTPDTETIAAIQATADKNIRVFGLGAETNSATGK
jgi:pyruvate ferredoxin oxidoreductase beta subunit